MRCKRCHRIIKDPESIKLGYGPVCLEREFGIPAARRDKRRKQAEADEDAPVDGQLTIWDFVTINPYGR